MPKLPVYARRVPAKWYAATVGTIGLAVSAMFGGLHPVPHASTDHVRVNKAIHGGPWNVSIVDARILKSQKGLEVTKAGDRWLSVIATVTVTADDSRGDLADIMRLPHALGVRSEAPDRILLARDGTDFSYLNPGMSERIAFVWEQQPPSGALPATVDVNVYGETWRESTLTGNYAWFDRHVIATVAAPLVDKRT